MNRLSAETAEAPSARMQTPLAEAPSAAQNIARGYVKEPVSKASLYRFRAVATPAMTGATIAWAACIAGLQSLGSNARWAPQVDDLVVIWLLTAGFAYLASHLTRIKPLWSSILTTLIGCSIGLANSYAAHQYRSAPWPDFRPTYQSIFVRNFPEIFAFVALLGVIWIPLVYLSTLRHRTLAETQKGKG
ncbi:MAG: hypothetical protein ACO1SV_12585 [Fimbriimonas sp.]